MTPILEPSKPEPLDVYDLVRLSLRYPRTTAYLAVAAVVVAALGLADVLR